MRASPPDTSLPREEPCGRDFRQRGARRRRRAAGFTFLELIIVLAVISFLFAIGIPTFRGLTPKYRLRSAARALGTTLETTRLSAMGRGLWMGIHYTLTPTARESGDSSYYQVIPPPPEDFPDQPLADRKLLDKQYFDGVKIARVILSSGQVVDRGSFSLMFSPMGNAGSHIVVLEGQEGLLLTLKMSCITGVIEFFDGGDVTFQHFTE